MREQAGDELTDAHAWVDSRSGFKRACAEQMALHVALSSIEAQLDQQGSNVCRLREGEWARWDALHASAQARLLLRLCEHGPNMTHAHYPNPNPSMDRI